MSFKEAVYITLNRKGVLKMYKNLPVPGRGEIVVKLMIQATDSAFREPTLVREVSITDPFDGMYMPDVDFSQPFITEAEAELLKARRRAQLVEMLESQGYTVKPPEPPEDTDEQPPQDDRP